MPEIISTNGFENKGNSNKIKLWWNKFWLQSSTIKIGTVLVLLLLLVTPIVFSAQFSTDIRQHAAGTDTITPPDEQDPGIPTNQCQGFCVSKALVGNSCSDNIFKLSSAQGVCVGDEANSLCCDDPGASGGTPPIDTPTNSPSNTPTATQIPTPTQTVVTCVHQNPQVSVYPTTESTITGSTSTYDVHIINTDSSSCSASTYSIAGFSAGGLTQQSYTTLAANPQDFVDTFVTVANDASINPGTYFFNETASNTTVPNYSGQAAGVQLTVNPRFVCNHNSPNIYPTDPLQAGIVVNRGSSQTVGITLVNNDDVTCGTSLYTISPSALNASYQLVSSGIGMATVTTSATPGCSDGTCNNNIWNGSVTITIDNSLPSGLYTLRLIAAGTTAPNTLYATGKIDINVR